MTDTLQMISRKGTIPLLLLLAVTLISAGIHLSGQAFFSFWSENDRLKLTAKVETHDLKETLELAEGASMELAAAHYVQEHFNCVINGEAMPLKFQDANTVSGWTELAFELDLSVSNIGQIKVTTDCFLDLSADQVNTVAFNLKAMERSYTLDKKRKTITVDFK